VRWQTLVPLLLGLLGLLVPRPGLLVPLLGLQEVILLEEYLLQLLEVLGLLGLYWIHSWIISLSTLDRHLPCIHVAMWSLVIPHFNGLASTPYSSAYSILFSLHPMYYPLSGGMVWIRIKKYELFEFNAHGCWMRTYIEAVCSFSYHLLFLCFVWKMYTMRCTTIQHSMQHFPLHHQSTQRSI